MLLRQVFRFLTDHWTSLSIIKMFALHFTGTEFAFAYVKDTVKWLTEFQPATVKIGAGFPMGKGAMDGTGDTSPWLEVLAREQVSYLEKEQKQLVSPNQIFYPFFVKWKKKCLSLLQEWKEPIGLAKQYNPFVLYLHSPKLDPVALNHLRCAAKKAQWGLAYVPARDKEDLPAALHDYKLKPLLGNIALGHGPQANVLAHGGEYPTMWVHHYRIINVHTIPFVYGYRFRSVDNLIFDTLELKLKQDVEYTFTLISYFTSLTYKIEWTVTSEDDILRGTLEGTLPVTKQPSIDEWMADHELALLWSLLEKTTDQTKVETIHDKFNTLKPEEVRSYLAELDPQRKPKIKID